MPTTLKETVEIGNKAYKLPTGIQDSIIGLIDFKTNHDMKEVIAEIRSLRTDMDGKFIAIDGKFTAMDGKFTAMDGKFSLIDSKFSSLDNRVKLLYWIIGVVAIPIILLLITSVLK